MKRGRGGLVVGALVLLSSIGSFGLGGCGDGTTADDETTVSTTDDLWRRSRGYRRPTTTTPTTTPTPTDTGGTGGQQPGTSTAGCEACTEAYTCCHEVAPGSALCTYDATYCASLDDVRRAAYVNACLTLKSVTVQGWQSRGMTPPAACL